jgi:hypothetical protein
MQTSIEWLYDELAKNNNSNDSIKDRIYKQSQIWKDAKEMHRKEILDAYMARMDITDKEYFKQIIGVQYYNETFKKD